MKKLTALVLLAGIGKRLESLSLGTPKCLVEIGHKPLLWYSINNLRKIGVSEYVFVVGYEAGQIVTFGQTVFPDLPIQYIYNNKFETTNSIYSYYLARERIINRNYLRLEGDLLYTRKIIQKLITHKESPASAVEKKIKKSPEEYSVRVDDRKGTILKYGKDIPVDVAFGEAKGIEFITSQASKDVCISLKQLIPNQANTYAEIAYQNMIDHNKNVYYKENDAYDFWCEVDTREDLEFAKKHYKKCI